MNSDNKIIGVLLATTILSVGCNNVDENITKDEHVNVKMAYVLSPHHKGNLSRMSSDVIASTETTLRYPRSMRFIPLINNDPAQIDVTWKEPISKENPNSRFYYSNFCSLNIGVNGFLIYGNVASKPATVTASSKMYNGSIIENIPENINDINDYQEDVSFNLEQIYPDISNAPAEAQTLADYMTAIAEAGGWNNSLDSDLKELFNKFTNDGKPLPGSTANLKKWIEAIRTGIHELQNNGYSAVLDAVDAVAAEKLEAMSSYRYPRNLELPDGAAILRWADVKVGDETVKKFVPQIRATTLDNINSMARFTYPAPLYFFGASEIKTSDEIVDLSTTYNDAVSDASGTAWDKVLAIHSFNKTSVTLNTKTVVITNPVQYAVALLKVNIKALSATLKDAEGKDVSVNNTTFPLTGIIVCGQHPLDYRFEPKEIQQGTVSDADVKFIYDNQVESDSYLTAQSDWKPGCNTLVFQSYKKDDVNIILEFQNNGADFKGIDGTIYQGTRFYLIGKVDPALYNFEDPNVNIENKDQVFTKDYITTVNMTVSSLARAYNVPPNLLMSNLEIGVETTPQWEGVTPTVIRLE